MASIAISAPPLTALKKALRSEFPDVRSAHLSEALASALGRRTYAALLVDIEQQASDPAIELLSTERFLARLQGLGYTSDPEFNFGLIGIPEVLATEDYTSQAIEYKSKRDKAWRNLMVFAINEGIRQKLFSLRPGDNRWPGAVVRSDGQRPGGHVYNFVLPNGAPVQAYVNDIGFDELVFHAAVNPKGDHIMAMNAGFHAGDAFGATWLERKKGAWMQSSSQFHCRKSLMELLATLSVNPQGFGDRGKVIL